jgi:ABC-type sugar transport system permease subunit
MKRASPVNVGAGTSAAAIPAVHVRRARYGARLTPYLYLVPMVVLVSAFLLYPAVSTIWISFTNWNGLNSEAFIGLQNYTQLLADPAFSTSFHNTIYWVIGVLLLQVGLGLLLAVALNNVVGGSLLKTIFYIPAALSGAASGVIWYFIFDPDQGVLNTFLRAIHLDGLTQQWLTTPPINTFAMIGAATWLGLGPNIVLFLVGLQNIPRDPIEAALIEGAGPLQLFWKITVPLLRPMLTVVVAIALINSFKVFDLIWAMTQGGPYRSSETLAVTMYRESFVSFHLAYGAAVAVVLTVIVTVISIFYIRSMFHRDVGVF